MEFLVIFSSLFRTHPIFKKFLLNLFKDHYEALPTIIAHLTFHKVISLFKSMDIFKSLGSIEPATELTTKDC